MPFYNNPVSRSILYVTPEGDGYEIGVYGEEYPDGRTETVTGTANRVSDSRKDDYIEHSEEHNFGASGEMDIEDVPQSAIDTLRRELSEENAP